MSIRTYKFLVTVRTKKRLCDLQEVKDEIKLHLQLTPFSIADADKYHFGNDSVKPTSVSVRRIPTKRRGLDAK